MTYVRSIDQISEIVSTCLQVGAFSFDVETRGNIDSHPQIREMVEEEWAIHLKSLKSKNIDVLTRSKEALETRWRQEIALNPLLNEVTWIGIATEGKSWAIPMGHRNGALLEPAIVGDGSSTPPEGFRKILASGKESMAKSKFYIPPKFSGPPKQLSKTAVFETLQPLFSDTEIIKVGHNVKFDARTIRKYLDGNLPSSPFMDTMVMQHILDENLARYGLEHLISHNFDGHDAYFRDGKLGKIIDVVSFGQAVRYVHLDARWTWLLYKKLNASISKDKKLTKALRKDMETLYVLMDMEDNGIPVAKRQMLTLGKDLDSRMKDLLLEMFSYTPVGFNPDSVKSKRDLLYGKKIDGGLGLKSNKKTEKGQMSVDDDALTALRDKHPIVPMLLEWSEIKKLKSTYVDGLLPKLVDNRLHPSFHLHRAVTGRLSSSSPNLQNIPRDASVRSLFVSPPGEKLLVFDYDQIELRVMCMFSQDPVMSEFFLKGIDIHTGTAATCFKKKVEDVTPEERQIGKGVNFLMGYGGGYKKLSAQLGIDEAFAKTIITNYHSEYAKTSYWKRTIVGQAQRDGYVSTMNGRRRRLPELSDSSFLQKKASQFLHSNPHLTMTVSEVCDMFRSTAERQAINAVVQGSAADICKQAMIDCFAAFKGTEARLLVQVHDELLVSCPEDRADHFSSIMMEAMGHGKVIKGIPLKVSGHSAYSWSEAKGK